VPTSVSIDNDDDREMVPLPNITIKLRALDLDRRETGWYGVVSTADVDQVRLPISLYPTINPESLEGATEITADIILESRRDDDGEWHPRRIHVVNIH
jgi:hypothetical protein